MGSTAARSSAGRIGGRVAPALTLDEGVRAELEGWVRGARTEQRLVLRARIVLLAAKGTTSCEVAAELGCTAGTVGKWRRRFASQGTTGLRDAPRSGRRPKFTAEQKARVIQKAVEAPRANGLPITQWSARSLSTIAVAAGITTSIHPTTVWRWLNEADLQPHRCRYWLKITAPDFEERMKDVTGLYLRTPALAKEGVKVFCVDEKTSIQALERQTPDSPLRPGKPLRRDHRYIRHGTTHLLGAFDVATGKVWGVYEAKRPAKVFAAFLRRVCEGESVKRAPNVHFVMDQVSTHWHHEVCKAVAELSGRDYDPKAHKTGASRRAFLADTTKRVVVHFTPVRASWLDQIEIWFSQLARQVLNRGSFTSIQDLQQQISAFIDYYNRSLARPYRWTYTGRPCTT